MNLLPRYATDEGRWPDAVKAAQDASTKRLGRILEMRTANKRVTFVEIAEELGVSRQRASKLYRKALERWDATITKR